MLVLFLEVKYTCIYISRQYRVNSSATYVRGITPYPPDDDLKLRHDAFLLLGGSGSDS